MISQNFIPAEPELKDALELLRKNIFINLNCHAIAKVQIFNSVNQSATATVNYKKTYFEYNTATGTYVNRLVDYPFLADCPVIFLGGGQSALTFPVQTGDDCLVFFNDRDIDNWWAGSSTSPVNTPRLHSFSDGIILVGLRSLNSVLAAFDAARACLRYGLTTRVAVGSAGASLESDVTGARVRAAALVDISTAAAGSLGMQLQSLITQLTMLTTALATLTVSGVVPGGGSSGPPTNAAVFVAIQASITSIATQLGTLLE